MKTKLIMKTKKTLEDFTPEIQAKIPAYKDAVLKGLVDNRNEHFSLESTVKYVQRIYELAGEKTPLVFVAKNQLEYKILFEIIPAILKKESSSLRSSLDSSLDSSLRSSLRSSLDSSLDSSLGSSLDSSLDSSLGSSLGSNKNRSSWAWYCSVYSRVYFTWYKFIQDEFKIEHPLKDTLNELYDLSLKSFVSRCWFTKSYVLVLKSPNKVNFNANNQLHSVTEPSYFHEGNERYYHVNNVQLSEQTFFEIREKKYTTEQFFKEQNEETKSAIIAMMQELYGDTYVFDFIRSVMSEIDTYVDKKDEQFLEGTVGMNVGVYTLFKGEINDTAIAYVRCYCPSTDRMFFLGVEPKHNKAKDAIASLYRVPRKLVNCIEYIQRQGERFSTVFSNEGTAQLKLMSKEEISDSVGISGSEYFEKMKHEY